MSLHLPLSARARALSASAAAILVGPLAACRQLVGITDNPPEDLVTRMAASASATGSRVQVAVHHLSGEHHERCLGAQCVPRFKVRNGVRTGVWGHRGVTPPCPTSYSLHVSASTARVSGGSVVGLDLPENVGPPRATKLPRWVFLNLGTFL